MSLQMKEHPSSAPVTPRHRIKNVVEVLASNQAKAAFREFLSLELSLENLNFIETVSAYKQKHSGSNIDLKTRMVNAIYTKYILPSTAESMLNISASVYGAVTASIYAINASMGKMEPPIDIFDDAEKEISFLMEDPFFRFRLTDVYKKFLADM
jgi:hypothetical protein